MEDLQTLANILVAASVTHGMHSLMEPVGMRSKLSRLEAYINKRPWKEMKVNIDTRPKALGIGFGVTAVLFVITLLIVSGIDPQVRTAIILAVGIMALVEFINTISIDRYHVEIEKITKPFMKKAKRK